MDITKFDLHLPYGKPLKSAEKEKLVADLLSAFKSLDKSPVDVVDMYYESKHALPETVTLVLIVVSAIADIYTIAKAIRDFLKNRPELKELHIKSKSIDIVLKGNMSDETIQKILEEGRKIVESEKTK